MASRIPVVDMGKLGLGCFESPQEEERETVGSEIAEAFRNVGFVYLKNHGIPQQVIEEVFSSSKEFFELDSQIKGKYSRGVTDIQGYTEVNRERLATDKDIKELRESYDINRVDGMFPKEVPSLNSSTSRIIQYCKDLSKRLLTLMELALGLNRNYFLSSHQRMFGANNASCLRLLYYPPLSDGYKEGLIRCGQHTDYGTFTLLFQDSMGGLEVLNRAGQWLHADPIPGTILVNIGDLMQFWTNNEFVATEHRVLVPKEEVKQGRARQSVVCFVHPDDEVLIEPQNSCSSVYSPITSKEHTHRRFQETYSY